MNSIRKHKLMKTVTRQPLRSIRKAGVVRASLVTKDSVVKVNISTRRLQKAVLTNKDNSTVVVHAFGHMKKDTIPIAITKGVAVHS